MSSAPGNLREAAAAAVDPSEVQRLAEALVAARSENPGGSEDEAAGVAGDALAALGARIEVVRSSTGRPNVIARLGPDGGPSLAWNGHLDVVPAGDPETWTGDPWIARIANGRLVGRGAVDMKGAVAAAIGAAAAIGRAGIELGGSLVFHLVADEELAGTQGTKVLLEQGLLTQDAAIVGEPTDLQLGLAERGGAWITLTSHGRAAHGSQPEQGTNAVTSMARLLLRLEEALPDRSHPLVGRPTVNAALISGGSALNAVPDRCEVIVDRRTLPGETWDDVRAPFDRLVGQIRDDHPEVDLDVELREWTDAAEAEAGTPIVGTLRGAIESVRGVSPAITGFTGITDARFYLNDAGIPAVICGPGSLSVAHTADEWVGLDELADAARIYAWAFVDALGA